jgi:hypothetical protein
MEMSPERLLFGVGIPLSKFMEADNCPSSLALGDALGDAYLCRHNPVFARVRESALEFGYSFSARDTPMWRDYLATPLTTLHQILDGKIIPYYDTRETFRRLLDINPSISLTPGFILDSVKRNYAFHESAHCVAHSVLAGEDAGLRLVARGEKEQFALEAVLAESFANTVEKLGSLYRQHPLWDDVFYCLNSYVGPREETTIVLEKATAETGEYLRFALLFLASFEANLTPGDPGAATYGRIGNAANWAAGVEEIAREVIDLGFKLSNTFREYTGPTYFEFLGCRKEFTALSGSGWLDDPDHRGFVQRLIPVLFEKAVKKEL